MLVSSECTDFENNPMKGGKIPYLVAMVGGGWLRLFLFYLMLTTDHLTHKKNFPFGEMLKLKLHSKGRMTT